LLVLATVGGLAGIDAAGGPVLRAAATAVAAAGYALGAVGVLGLLWKRLFDPRLRDFTSPVSQFNLVLLLAVFATGLGALGTADYVGGVTTVLGALCTADASVAAPGMVTAHVGVTLLFLAYLPFTPMMHFVAKYFTYHEVRWNDEPMARGSRMERDVEKLLAQPVTWAGPHVHANGTKTWVDIATEETRP